MLKLTKVCRFSWQKKLMKKTVLERYFYSTLDRGKVETGENQIMES